MYCRNCGAPLGESSAFCPFCGAPANGSVSYSPAQQMRPPYYGPAVLPPYNTLCIVGFICSFIPYVRTAGLILCIIGMVQCSSTGERGRGLGIAGMAVAVGSVLLTIALLLLPFILAGVGAAMTM